MSEQARERALRRAEEWRHWSSGGSPPAAAMPADLIALADALARAEAEAERLRGAAEMAVQACLVLLPLHGSWTGGYEFSGTTETTVRALPEEWQDAAEHIARLHAALSAEARP